MGDPMLAEKLIRFWRDETGATAVEYGLVAALVGIAVIATAKSLGTNISKTFDKTAKNIS